MLEGLRRGVRPMAKQCRYFSTSESNIYDVVIVGGGLVGSAAAAALSANKWTEGLRVAVLDRQAPPETSAPLEEVPGLRVSTITPSSVKLLKDCTEWQDVAPPRSAAFSTMQVWDWGGNGYVRYHASDAGADVIGYVAENSVLHTAFLRQLSRPGRQPVFQYPAMVKALHLPAYGRQGLQGGAPLAEIELQDGRKLRSKLVIGADGGRSQVRQLADLRTESFPYHQRGVVATVKTDPDNHTAHQRFLKTGPLALLPVRDGLSNIVWSTTPHHAQQLESCSPFEFAEAVNEALNGGVSPASTSTGPGFDPPPFVLESVGSSPKSFPLVYAHAGRYVRPRLALIGDAAHSIHPLAGQGVNLGFGDVIALVQTLAHAVECGRDLGEMALLEELYEKPRQKANTQMMSACDSLLRLFRPQEGLTAMARNFGLGMINSSSLAKQQIMKYAMGL